MISAVIPGRAKREPGISRFSDARLRIIVRSFHSRPGMTPLAAHEPGKFLHHALIDRPLERNDQLRQVLHRLPAPTDELSLVAAPRVRDVDLAILAGEAHGEPFLPLPAIAALPGAAGDGARNIVDQPVGDFAELL